MKIKKKQCFLLLMLSIIFILAIGITSATEINNDTAEIIKDNNEVSSIDTQTKEINEKIVKNTNNNQTTKTDIYANSNANSNNAGTTKTEPTTLSNAINNAQNGETIYLTTTGSQDTYKIASPLTISKNINIVGERGKTIILDGQGTSGIFNIYTSTVKLENIQIINSKTTTAPITATDSDLTITGMTFKNNIGSIGGAILSKESNLKISGSVFTNNTSEKQGGAVTQLGNKTLTVTGSTFTQNSAKYDGGSIYSIQSKATISSSTFNNNNARNGGALYLGNNVNNIQLQVTNSVYTNNRASQKADAIWTNYHITVNNNAFISSNNKNWVFIDKNCNNNLNSNWWSTNSPNFEVITGGFIPTNWRLMKVTNQTSGNTNKLTVSINSLSDSTTSTTVIPARVVTYTADSGSFTANTQSITGTVTNTYNGNSANVKVKIDNQEVKVNTLTEPYLSINNVTSTPGSQVTFKINANRAISGQLTLKVNGVTITPTLSNGLVTYSYTIPSSWKSNNYTTTLTYDGNNVYRPKTVNGYLYVKDSTIVIVPVTNNEIMLSTASLPASYDLRSSGLVTPVKSQGGSGSCWAFSSLASLESVLLKKTGVAYDLSENNMKNVLKKYSVIGDSESNPNSGFNDLEPIGYLVGWYGPVMENEDSYQASSYVSPVMNSNIHVQDVYIIPNRRNSTDNTLIKRAVYQFGAVSVGIFKPTTTNSYTTGHEIDHSVTIVGWDDNYSKSNFSPNPPGNGAFIIKNSWGNSTGNRGYHYISYYDESIASVGITNLTNEQLNYVVLQENRDNYDNIYQYDVAVNTLDESSLTDYIAYKNVYTAIRDENIAAIGTYFQQESSYTLELSTNNKVIYTQSGKVTLPGYRTIRLNQYVSIPKDQQFTVVIKISGKEEKATLVEYSDLYYSSIHKGTSFLSFDGKTWEDLYDYECTAPLKVYTKDTPVVSSTAVESNRTVTVTTTISNVRKAGTLTYYADNEAVMVNGKVLTQSVSKDSTYTVTFNDNTNLKNYVLTVVYSSENYAVKQNISLSNLYLTDTKLTVNRVSDTKWGDSVTITGTLSDNSNNKLVNSQVTLTVNNDKYTVTTNNNGVYTLTYKTSVVGKNNLSVKYGGNTVYAQSSVSSSFNVLARDTRISLNSVATVKYSDSMTISGKLVSDTGVALKNMVVSIKINSNTVKVTTNANGIFTYNRKANLPGTSNMTVSFAGTAQYKSSIATGKFNVVAKETKISVNKVNKTVYYDKATITGKFTNIDGVAFKNVNVLVNVNGVKKYAKTNSNGVFTLKVTATRVGTNNVTVSFAGNSKYKATSKKVTFKVVKRPTMITLKKINQTIYYDKAVITGTFSSSTGSVFKYSNVIVSVNGVKRTVKTNANGVFTLKVTATRVGTNNVTVLFKGNNKYKYNSSKAKFKVVKRPVEISINKISQVAYNDKVTVTGTFSSTTGSVFKYCNVVVNVNGVKRTVKTNAKGVFTLKMNATKLGTNKVSVMFKGNNNYRYNSAKTTFRVIAKPTRITVNRISSVSVGKTVNISGKFVTSSGGLLKNRYVTLNVNGKKYNAKVNATSMFSLKYKTSVVGTNNVTVSYAGNKYYKASSAKKSFVVKG